MLGDVLNGEVLNTVEVGALRFARILSGMKMTLRLLLLLLVSACGGKSATPKASPAMSHEETAEAQPEPAEDAEAAEKEEELETLQTATEPVNAEPLEATQEANEPADTATVTTPAPAASELPPGWPGDANAFRACLACGCAGAGDLNPQKTRVCVANKAALGKVKRDTAKKRLSPKSCRRRLAKDRNPTYYAVCAP